jgi:hypothetical protein
MGVYIRQSHREQQTKPNLLTPGYLQPQNDRQRQDQYPQIRDEVCNIRKVAECDEVKAVTVNVLVPEPLDRSALKTEDKFHGHEPEDDEDRSENDDPAEDGLREDAMVEGQDRELRAGDGEVVEVAEDVVALFRSRWE